MFMVIFAAVYFLGFYFMRNIFVNFSILHGDFVTAVVAGASGYLASILAEKYFPQK